MTQIMPLSCDVDDIGDVPPLRPHEVGFFFHSESPDDGCALCEAGFCISRYIFDTTDDDPMIIHGAYGAA